jgi:hypothetical protein
MKGDERATGQWYSHFSKKGHHGRVLTHKKPRLDAIISALWISLDKPERWTGLSDIEHILPDPIFYQTFVDVWTNSEANHLNLALIDELIDRRGVCARSLMPHLSARDRKLFDGLKDDPVVYRGASVERPYIDYSWTRDREQAIWSAKRCSRATPALISGTVDPRAVLFAYAGRGESEVAIRTADVADKVVQAIGAYKSERAADSAGSRGPLDALSDPASMLTFRFRAMMRLEGAEVADLRRLAMRDIEALEDLGFRKVTIERRRLLDKVDWDRLGAGKPKSEFYR